MPPAQFSRFESNQGSFTHDLFDSLVSQTRGFGGSGFEDYFRCYPITKRPGSNGENLANYGGKIFLPVSSLNKLTRLQILYPMMFQLTNEANGFKTHSGVLEFTAEEGRAYIPTWMMNVLKISTGGLIKIANLDLPLGDFVKLEPQSVDFLDITDPKAVLENTLRQFTTLTVDDIIEINYNDTIYGIKVVEVKPENDNHGICVVERDLETDFAPPVGYVEPDYKKNIKKNSLNENEAASRAKCRDVKVQGKMAENLGYLDMISSKTSENKSRFRGSGHKISGKSVENEDTGAEKKVADVDLSKIELDGNNVKKFELPPNQLFFGFPLVPPVLEEDEEASEKNTTDVFKGEGQTLRKAKK